MIDRANRARWLEEGGLTLRQRARREVERLVGECAAVAAGRGRPAELRGAWPPRPAGTAWSALPERGVRTVKHVRPRPGRRGRGPPGPPGVGSRAGLGMPSLPAASGGTGPDGAIRRRTAAGPGGAAEYLGRARRRGPGRDRATSSPASIAARAATRRTPLGPGLPARGAAGPVRGHGRRRLSAAIGELFDANDVALGCMLDAVARGRRRRRRADSAPIAPRPGSAGGRGRAGLQPGLLRLARQRPERAVRVLRPEEIGLTLATAA